MVDRELNILFASENMSEQLGPLQVRWCEGNTVLYVCVGWGWGAEGRGKRGGAEGREACSIDACVQLAI